jgi:glutamine synthetase
MTASASNDHRLGANEAPPAIISIFLGAELNAIINSIIDGKRGAGSKACREMRVGVDSLPALPQDSTDRNRTSPFAFTGNKFEFRTVGSSQSCSNVNAVINTIVAESMDYISDALEKLPPAKFNSGLQKLIRQIFTDNRRIIFNGDGYTEEWQEEAKRRGLPNLRSTPEAIAPMLEPRNRELFAKYGVFIGKELASRHQVFMEDYRRKVRIECELALEMATGMIQPVVAEQYGKLAATYRDVSALAKSAAAFRNGTSALQSNLVALGAKYQQLEECRQELRRAINGNSEEQMLEAMAELRKVVDALELIVDDERWPLPKYREMLFIY